MSVEKTFNIAIIGKGKVGKSLAHLFSLKHDHVTLIGRDLELQKESITHSDIIFITTNDGSIESVAKKISPFITPSTIVSHCSGALDSTVLKLAKDQGAVIASTHPLNTFPTLEASLATFKDFNHATSLYCEGDRLALEQLIPLFQRVGFSTIEIPSNAKTAYHTACVFACNYLTTLMDVSLNTAELGGLDRNTFWRAIQPIVQATLSNISNHGTTNALSGPIARGDTTTITHHLDFLSERNSEFSDMYLTLARQTLRLAKQQGSLDEDKLSAINEILNL